MADNIRIRLTWPEVELAAQVGMQRNIQCLKEGRKPGAGQASDNLWTTNIEGAQAEMAVAKYKGVYWSGNVGNYDADDVAIYQVRANLTRRTDCMYLRPWDKPDKAYISVLSFVPDFIICGWMLCRDGRREEWLGGAPGRPPCYCVPRAELHSMALLPAAPATGYSQKSAPPPGNAAPVPASPWRPVGADGAIRGLLL